MGPYAGGGKIVRVVKIVLAVVAFICGEDGGIEEEGVSVFVLVVVVLGDVVVVVAVVVVEVVVVALASLK